MLINVLGLGPDVWALPVPGGSGSPWAHRGVGGLVRVLVPGWLLWDLRRIRRFFFF